MIKTRYFSKLLILFMILNLVLSFAISPASAEEPGQVNLENIVENIPDDIEVNGELFENAKIKVINFCGVCSILKCYQYLVEFPI
ncbi:hypothetical protein [Bacillus alveayuensis]|uniref:hypothetical protein n=1 Tax=Aeribacillus alveayuensis TaxID=279215 RepID=UPI0005CD3BAB|nr:hypothetical protein [Bacillus alveayuensis]